MAKGTFQVSAKRLLGLCLIIFSAVSCTYDYFVDENNFSLYVPQIQNSEISNFYVAFHDADGNHVRTRLIEAPFDKDDKMKEGILRFKLIPGEYSISCFADYAPERITSGEPFANSYGAYEKYPDGDNLGDDPANPYQRYKPWNIEPGARALFLSATAFPIGHPNTQIPTEADIDETTMYEGKVIANFIDMPAGITRVELISTGLATKLDFNGAFGNFTPADCISVSANRSDFIQSSTGTLTHTQIINPSKGINFIDYLNSNTTAGAQSMQLEVRFYNESNMLIGNTIVNDADIARLALDGNAPTDGAGNPVANLILEPQKALIFWFKGFTVFQISLKGWGDIVEGGTTWD